MVSGEQVFRKHGSGASDPRHGPDFYRYEAAGMDWLRAAPGRPRIARVVEVDDDTIVLERLDPARSTARAAEEFGRRLAALHAAGAPAFGAPPEGWTGRTFIGNRPQECVPTARWGEFYAEQRVRLFVRIAVDLGALDGPGLQTVERACDLVAAGEFDDDEPPARLHGDLWSGNVLWTGGGAGVEVALIDPAAHGGHR